MYLTGNLTSSTTKQKLKCYFKLNLLWKSSVIRLPVNYREFLLGISHAHHIRVTCRKGRWEILTLYFFLVLWYWFFNINLRLKCTYLLNQRTYNWKLAALFFIWYQVVDHCFCRFIKYSKQFSPPTVNFKAGSSWI